MRKILGLIVTYNPDLDHLNNLIQALLPQVEALIVIDNNSANFELREIKTNSPSLEILINDENLGLATAYNQGCAIAKEKGCSHFILFDQDSMPASNMVEMLYEALRTFNKDELRAAVAGPKYRDKKGQKLSPFVRIRDLHLERVECNDDQIVEVDHLISSGSLIDLRAVDQIGDFVDCLFIDYVDTEWCLRARTYNLLVLGVGSAYMLHNIGEAYLKIFNRELPSYPPHRLYYRLRNQLWLIKQPWVSWRWRVIDSVRCLKLMIVFVFFAPDKLKNFQFMLKGIRDGILSRMGKQQL